MCLLVGCVLQGRVRSLGPSAGLLTGATQLRKDLGAMEKRAGALQGTLAAELTGARTLQMDAQQVGVVWGRLDKSRKLEHPGPQEVVVVVVVVVVVPVGYIQESCGVM